MATEEREYTEENRRRLREEGTEVARGTEETEGKGKQMEQEEQTDRGSKGEDGENMENRGTGNRRYDETGCTLVCITTLYSKITTEVKVSNNHD